MNRRTFWILAVGGLAFWSLLTWGAYALVTGAGGLLAANADLVGGGAEVQYWVQWALRVLEGVGVAVVWIVWALGALLVVAIAAAGAKMLAAARGLRRVFDASSAQPHQRTSA